MSDIHICFTTFMLGKQILIKITNAFKMNRVLIIFAFILFPHILFGSTDYDQLYKSVMSYYNKDGNQEKILSAQFILNNMKFHHYKYGLYFDSLFDGIDSIFNANDYPQCREKIRIFESQFHGKTEFSKDFNCLCDSDIINNINSAYSIWKEGSWSRHLSFSDYCEYLLPYKVGEEKPSVEWRNQLRNVFYPTSEIYQYSDDRYYQSYFAACIVNDKLRKMQFHNSFILTDRSIELPISVLSKMKMGQCYDYAKLTTYVMRSCGIPVAIDFTPQWPDRAGAHCWNSLLDNFGNTIPFMGCESNPGTTSKIGRRMAKVFRLTFSYQEGSLYNLNKKYKKPIPSVFNTPFIKDVSNLYFKGSNLLIDIDEEHSQRNIIYLAVFGNNEWIPVDYSEISPSNKAFFSDIGRDIVYLPVFWSENGIIPAGNAVCVDLNGKIDTLKPNMQELQTITINRTYPQFYKYVRYRNLLKGGYFECSNSDNFSNAIKCTETIKPKYNGYDTLNIKTNEKYRYWRYVSPNGGKCNISEIRFLNGCQDVPIAKSLSDGDGRGGNETNDSFVFDGKESTYFVTKESQDGWVGADMGKPVHLDKVAFIAKNDDNDIIPGQTYELCYYENGIEKSLGVKTATLDSLTFDNVPSNSLYILHNLDKGDNERIFILNKNKIYWY